MPEEDTGSIDETSLLEGFQRDIAPRYLIRRMRLAHCKRGPERCEACREWDTERICLLDLCPEGEMQRRVIQLGEDGPWREFDIVRTFDSVAEARAYARQHGIEDVTL